MLFDFQHNVQIAGGPAIGPRLAFAGDAQPRSGVHARRNSQLNRLFAFEASLAAHSGQRSFTICPAPWHAGQVRVMVKNPC